MPLLARVVSAPLFIDVRRGAVAGLADLLADQRISPHGDVAVVVGEGQGPRVAETIRARLPNAAVLPVQGGTLAAATSLEAELRSRSWDAVVGIGGGKTLDVAKFASFRLGLPMVSVATSLAHDGLASPVSVLDHDGGRGSYGVHIPIAVVVDLDFVRAAPQSLTRSGIGDAVSNLSAVADWRLANEVRGEPIDGLALTVARASAESIVHRSDSLESDDFLTALAEALILSGLAMSIAGSSRPCSGGCHEISHAIDHLFPGTATHGEQVGFGALFTFFLREDKATFADVEQCLRRHGLPRTPADLGLTAEQFTEAVRHAPHTRPDRYTILEHLALEPAEARDRVEEFVRQLS
jgi:glycerol-1-phosphate dehydrogenase [NAD(P)+]